MEQLHRLLRGSLCLLVVYACIGCAFIGPQMEETQHVVRRGDTLDKISTIYYGTANKVDLIIRANPTLHDPKALLEPGLCVNVPVVARDQMN